MMKDESTKEDADWTPLQVIKNNFELNNLVSHKFIELLEKEFKDKKIDIINLTLLIGNKSKDEKVEKDKNNKNIDLIHLSHKSAEYKKEKKIIIDMNNPDSLEKIKNAIEKIDVD